MSLSLSLLTAGSSLAESGCTPGLIPKEEAAAGYEAQQMACVDKYAIRGDIDRCRARVKAAWATVPDAGVDAEGGAK